MTPNLHPASGNGDVIERLRRPGYWPEGAARIDPLIRRDMNEAADEIERLRGLLKLSEDSGDGKVREALNDLIDAFGDLVREYLETDPEEHPAIIDARKALAATPAPSPIDAEGMREALRFYANEDNYKPNQPITVQEDRGEIAREALAATPAREIDREKVVKIIEDELKCYRANESAHRKARIIADMLIGGRHV